MYLTDTEYAAKYGLFPDVQTFNRLAVRAESEIELRTFGRLSAQYETMAESMKTKVKNAIAELIFEMESQGAQADGQRVKSESVGSHSVTYEYTEGEQSGIDYGRIISRHLSNTGLLYRGVSW